MCIRDRYIRASEDEFGQPIFVADGFSNLVLHNIFDEEASSWLVCDSAAKTQDNFDCSLLRCLESSADAEFDATHFGVWTVRVCTPEEQHRFREVPELALRSVPRSIVSDCVEARGHMMGSHGDGSCEAYIALPSC